MLDYETFRESVEPLNDKIKRARTIQPSSVTEEDWSLLEEIFRCITVMASGTSIVGNSKVMAHMIPNIVAPIDRQYTLNYLRGNTNIKNDLDHEWSLMRGILSDFFIPVAQDEIFTIQAARWISDQQTYFWDTSVFKVIDNLVIGAMQ